MIKYKTKYTLDSDGKLAFRYYAVYGTYVYNYTYYDLSNYIWVCCGGYTIAQRWLKLVLMEEKKKKIGKKKTQIEDAKI